MNDEKYYLRRATYWYITQGQYTSRYLHRDGQIHMFTCADDCLHVPLRSPLNTKAYPGYWETRESAMRFFRRKMKGQELVK